MSRCNFCCLWDYNGKTKLGKIEWDELPNEEFCLNPYLTQREREAKAIVSSLMLPCPKKARNIKAHKHMQCGE